MKVTVPRSRCHVIWSVLIVTMLRSPEKAMAPHYSTIVWKIPGTEEPGGLQSMGLLRVRHDWATSLSLFTFIHWRRHGNPLQYSCLENPRDGRAWWAAVSGVAQSQTQLKQVSSSSSSSMLCSQFHLYKYSQDSFSLRQSMHHTSLKLKVDVHCIFL